MATGAKLDGKNPALCVSQRIGLAPCPYANLKCCCGESTRGLRGSLEVEVMPERFQQRNQVKQIGANSMVLYIPVKAGFPIGF